jgi:transcriptional regulator with XRE-family HTH domain
MVILLTGVNPAILSVDMTEDESASDRIAARIRASRKQRGWSMGELAVRCGLSENVIENIEGGRRDKHGQRRRHITIDEIEAIGEALYGHRFIVDLFQEHQDYHDHKSTEPEQMLKDPDIVRARQMVFSIRAALEAAEHQLNRMKERWRETNPA